MKRVVLYIRVSTLEQAQHGYSIAEQKERLINFCKAHGWLVVEVYVDSGYSGANLDRPGIQRLMSEVGKFDLVLVYKLDRLSRSQRDTLYLIEDILLPAGVDFVSMSEAFDTSVPFGRAMIGILSVFAQLEREQIKERTRMGKLARAKEGLYHGGPYIPIGYNYEGGPLLVNEYEAAQVRKIYEWYLDGMSPLKIAARLRAEGYTNRYGSWSERGGHISVLNVLSGEVYLGTLKYGEVTVENAHEAIIERDTFERVRAARAQRHEVYGDSAYVTKYLLSGMVFCGHCGGRYFVKHNYGGYKYYCCYSRARTAKHMIKSDTCENKNWPLDELGAKVEKEVQKVIKNSAYLSRLIRKKETQKKPPRGEEAVLRDKVAGLEKQITRFMDLYQNDTIPADVLSARIEKLYREKLAVDAQLAALVPPRPKVDYDAESITEIIAEVALYWDDAEPEQRRRIIQTLVRRIVLDGDAVNIEWSFLDE
jgi:site-specific DNA recombinase